MMAGEEGLGTLGSSVLGSRRPGIIGPGEEGCRASLEAPCLDEERAGQGFGVTDSRPEGAGAPESRIPKFAILQVEMWTRKETLFPLLHLLRQTPRPR